MTIQTINKTTNKTIEEETISELDDKIEIYIEDKLTKGDK